MKLEAAQNLEHLDKTQPKQPANMKHILLGYDSFSPSRNFCLGLAGSHSNMSSVLRPHGYSGFWSFSGFQKIGVEP